MRGFSQETETDPSQVLWLDLGQCCMWDKALIIAADIGLIAAIAINTDLKQSTIYCQSLSSYTEIHLSHTSSSSLSLSCICDKIVLVMAKLEV